MAHAVPTRSHNLVPIPLSLQTPRRLGACAFSRNISARTQVRKHGGQHGGHTWFMPAFNYYVKPLPGVELEIVNLDLNHVDSWKICVRLSRPPT